VQDLSEARGFDVIVVGGGPAGLCFAASMHGAPLTIALIERLEEKALADPPYDGREIALTLRSVGTLRELGIWHRLPGEHVAPLHGARVFNGDSLDSLDLRAPSAAAPQIGYLVSNHLLRHAAYRAARANERVSWFTQARISDISYSAEAVRVGLEHGPVLEAKLLVSADSRFSETRRARGIAARVHDFGRTMLVCRMAHEVAHQRIAWEWFGHYQTLARLPLNGQRSSVVLTLPHAQITRLLGLAPEAFERELERRFAARLGRMRLDSERFAYPLMGVYASRFIAERYAAIGDAAVGMHPVTAHGFNFGLSGQALLARLLREARRAQRNIADAGLLAHYERGHRQATLPLYLATNALARLYTDESAPARFARRSLLSLARRIPPIGSTLSRLLMQEGARADGILPWRARAHASEPPASSDH